MANAMRKSRGNLQHHEPGFIPVAEDAYALPGSRSELDAPAGFEMMVCFEALAGFLPEKRRKPQERFI
jgi:hypothetical protein